MTVFVTSKHQSVLEREKTAARHIKLEFWIVLEVSGKSVRTELLRNDRKKRPRIGC